MEQLPEQTPEQIGRERLALLGMMPEEVENYAQKPAFWNGQPVLDAGGNPVTIAQKFGTYTEHGVPEMFARIQDPATDAQTKEATVGMLRNAVRFAANEEMQA